MRVATLSLCTVSLLLAVAPAHANDWQTFIVKDGDGSDLAVMQGTAQYNFALFLLCRKDGQKHVLLQMGNPETPIATLKAASDITFRIQTDAGEHASTGLWTGGYGTGKDLLEYSNFYETNDIANFIGEAKNIVTFVYDVPSLKVHEGAVAFAEGAAEAAKKFNDFCQ